MADSYDDAIKLLRSHRRPGTSLTLRFGPRAMRWHQWIRVTFGTAVGLICIAAILGLGMDVDLASMIGGAIGLGFGAACVATSANWARWFEIERVVEGWRFTRGIARWTWSVTYVAFDRVATVHPDQDRTRDHVDSFHVRVVMTRLPFARDAEEVRLGEYFNLSPSIVRAICRVISPDNAMLDFCSNRE